MILPFVQLAGGEEGEETNSNAVVSVPRLPHLLGWQLKIVADHIFINSLLLFIIQTVS
jgi:hypothetical protein